MPPAVHLFAPDRAEIHDLDSWLKHAPPEGGPAQWKDGYSAKEQAKAWLRSGSPAMPEELWSQISPFVDDVVDEFYGRPEHTTALDGYSGPRQHDLFGCARRDGETTLVVGIEAKACEAFGGLVAERAAAEDPSEKRARCNLLSRALFGREVLDERTGAMLDEELGRHAYQLWTAAVGTLIEAQRRRLDEALLIVHQFVPEDISTGAFAGDQRNWAGALAKNDEALDTFAQAIQAAGSTSHETEYVQAGTKLHVAKVESTLAQ